MGSSTNDFNGMVKTHEKILITGLYLPGIYFNDRNKINKGRDFHPSLPTIA
jgi:hypothetical protein